MRLQFRVEILGAKDRRGRAIHPGMGRETLPNRPTWRFTDWRPGRVLWQFGHLWRATISELSVRRIARTTSPVNATTKVMFGTAAVLAVVAFAASRTEGYRSCGHKRYVFERLSPSTHCCSAAAEVVIALNQIYGEQEMFRLQQGSFASSLTQLRNAIPHRWPLSAIKFQAASNDWSCLVTRTGDLPGSYLLRSDGKIYFSEQRAPGTNSLLLRDNATGYSIGP